MPHFHFCFAVRALLGHSCLDMSTLGALILVSILGDSTSVPHPVLFIIFILILLHIITYLMRGLVCLVQETDGLIKHGAKALLIAPFLEVGTIVTILITKEVRLHMPLNKQANSKSI